MTVEEFEEISSIAQRSSMISYVSILVKNEMNKSKWVLTKYLPLVNKVFKIFFFTYTKWHL
jgi:hypothetical protein